MEKVMYEQLSAADEAHWWLKYRRFLAGDFLRKLNLPQNARVLDIGCGTGATTIYLSTIYKGSVTGMDLSEYALEFARKKYPQADFVHGDANKVAQIFGKDKFDLVTMFDVLCHSWIPDNSAVIRQIYEVLKPDGCILLTEPAFNVLYRKHDVQGKTKRRSRLKDIHELLGGAGFKVVFSTYFGSPFFFPALFFSMVDRLKGTKNIRTDDHGENLELKVPAAAINNTLFNLIQPERYILKGFGRLPFGISLIAIGRKEGG